MKNIKTIIIFKSNENIPFMTCIVNDIKENKNGINLTLENGELDRERMVNSYRRLFS